jgi:hypothetical protein
LGVALEPLLFCQGADLVIDIHWIRSTIIVTEDTLQSFKFKEMQL